MPVYMSKYVKGPRSLYGIRIFIEYRFMNNL